MIHRHWKAIVGLAAVALAMLACGAPAATPTPLPSPVPPTPTPPGPEARAGTWIGSTEFGTFTFDVAPDGQSVTGLSLAYNVGGLSGSIEPQGEFSIPIDQDGSFAMILEQLGLAFVGQISEDGQRATGTWEMDIALAGEVAEDWMVER